MDSTENRFGAAARTELLMRTADQLNALQNFQAATRRKGKETPNAKRIRALKDDEGKFADRPQVTPITDQAYLAAKLPVPASAERLFQQYRFYLLEFAFDLRPAKGWAFDSLTVEVTFNPDAPDDRPKVYALFPDVKFSQILKLGGKVEAALGAGLQFEAGLSPKELKGSAGSVKVGGSLHNTENVALEAIAGPFSFTWKKTLVKTTQPGLEWARWELNESEFNEGNAPGLMLVAQVPAGAKSVILRGQLTAKRDFRLFDYGLRDAVLHLDDVLQRFIKGGAPWEYGPVDWDLTRYMGLGGEQPCRQANTK